MPLSSDVIRCLLQQCTEKKNLSTGRRIHSLMVSIGVASIAILGDQLIRLFTSCGSLLDASQVFCGVSEPSTYTWQAIISAYTTLGESDVALTLYKKMEQEGGKPDKVTFLSILKACGNIGAIEKGLVIHTQIVTTGLDVDVVVGSCLIDMYAKCTCLNEAQKVFDLMPMHDVVSWGAMIAGYVNHGSSFFAIKHFEKMQWESIKPDNVIFSCILKACSSIGGLKQGRLVHDLIIRNAFESDMIVGSALIDIYAKWACLDEACNMFHKLWNKNIVSWNAMIAGYFENGHGLLALQLYEKMQEDGIQPNRITFLYILKACGSIEVIRQGRLIHNQIISSGLRLDVAVGNSLIDMYAKCGSLKEMQKVFEELQNRDAVSWSAMIAGYVHHELGLTAIECFLKMQQNGIEADVSALSSVLKACAIAGAIGHGQVIHEQIIQTEMQIDLIIETSLVDMYASCGSFEDARQVFDKLLSRDVVSWNAIISGYVNHGQVLQAFQLYEKMQQEGLKPSTYTISCILKLFKSTEAVEKGMVMHDEMMKSGLEGDVFIGSTLIDMYAQCGGLDEARKVFETLQNRNLVSWNAMIAGYAQRGDGLSALELFENMQLEGIIPDKVTTLCLLKACGSIGALVQGKVVHDGIVQTGFELDDVTGTALLDMYCRCGSLEEACKVHNVLPIRNAVSWGAIIAGCAQRGAYKLATQCLKNMQLEGFMPDGETYTSILAACSHSGQVEEGRWHFKCMRDRGITPSIEHLNCMVDLLGRAGLLNEARHFLLIMPIPVDVSGWTSLLTSCRTYSNVKLATHCFDTILQMNANIPAVYLLMSSIFANAHMWEDAQKILELRKWEGAWKKPGMAWIELTNKVHEFIVGNNLHPQCEEICVKSKTFTRQLKHEGLVPLLDLVLELCAGESSVHKHREEHMIAF